MYSLNNVHCKIAFYGIRAQICKNKKEKEKGIFVALFCSSQMSKLQCLQRNFSWKFRVIYCTGQKLKSCLICTPTYFLKLGFENNFREEIAKAKSFSQYDSWIINTGTAMF